MTRELRPLVGCRARTRTDSRVIGVDIARALAIIGMMAVHIGPTGAEGLPGRLYAIPHGRASLLFVLVAGIGISLLGRSRTRSRGSFQVTLLWRAVLLLPLGLALQLLDHGASVILQTYALLFVIAIGAEALPDRWLLAASGTAAVIGPAVFLWGSTRLPETFDRNPVRWGEPAGELLHGIVLSGPYPLVVWSAPMLFGMWVGRRDLRSRRLAIRLVLVGGLVAVASLAVSGALAAILARSATSVWLEQLVVVTPHSQMPLWLLNGSAVAVAILGVSLLLPAAFERLARPVVAAGQLALTIYVGHLVVLHLFPEVTTDAVGTATWRLGVASMVVLACSHAWRSCFGRGPLELLLRPPRRAPTDTPRVRAAPDARGPSPPPAARTRAGSAGVRVAPRG